MSIEIYSLSFLQKEAVVKSLMFIILLLKVFTVVEPSVFQSLQAERVEARVCIDVAYGIVIHECHSDLF